MTVVAVFPDLSWLLEFCCRHTRQSTFLTLVQPLCLGWEGPDQGGPSRGPGEDGSALTSDSSMAGI